MLCVSLLVLIGLCLSQENTETIFLTELFLRSRCSLASYAARTIRCVHVCLILGSYFLPFRFVRVE